MRALDRSGIFKARPMNWCLQANEATKSVALVIGYRITAELQDDGTWLDWSDFEDHEIAGYHYIVKKDGTPSTQTIEQLARAGVAWDGTQRTLEAGPPDVVCQITAEFEEYNGKDRLKVKWVNEENFRPGPKGADAATVASIIATHGSRIRAAVAAAKPAGATTTTKKAAPPAKAAQPTPPPHTDSDAPKDDDLPFEHGPAAVSGERPAGLMGAGGAVDNLLPGDGAMCASAAPAPGSPAVDMIDVALAMHGIKRRDIDDGEWRLLSGALAEGDQAKFDRAVAFVAKRKAVA